MVGLRRYISQDPSLEGLLVNIRAAREGSR